MRVREGRTDWIAVMLDRSKSSALAMITGVLVCVLHEVHVICVRRVWLSGISKVRWTQDFRETARET